MIEDLFAVRKTRAGALGKDEAAVNCDLEDPVTRWEQLSCFAELGLDGLRQGIGNPLVISRDTVFDQYRGRLLLERGKPGTKPRVGFPLQFEITGQFLHESQRVRTGELYGPENVEPAFLTAVGEFYSTRRIIIPAADMKSTSFSAFSRCPTRFTSLAGTGLSVVLMGVLPKKIARARPGGQ